MLEKPDLPDTDILSTLTGEFSLAVDRLVFIPRGTDRKTAAYRAELEDGRAFFVKLRRGEFDWISPALTRYLEHGGVGHVIAPVANKTGALWTKVDGYALIVFPYVEGQDGYEKELSDDQWREVGRVVRRLHGTDLPESLRHRIRRETYDPHWRQVLRTYLERSTLDARLDPITGELCALLSRFRPQILDLANRAESLAHTLRSMRLTPVLCHGDIHAGNVILTSQGGLYIVDWDEPIFAPKERDLMFVGAGLWGGARTPQQENALFYEGYGRTEINAEAIAYYRYERIVEDIAIFYERITSADEGPQDRERSLSYLRSNFVSNGTIHIACASDATRRSDDPLSC
jgi:spectinomycin phosphotransferase